MKEAERRQERGRGEEIRSWSEEQEGSSTGSRKKKKRYKREADEGTGPRLFLLCCWRTAGRGRRRVPRPTAAFMNLWLNVQKKKKEKKRLLKKVSFFTFSYFIFLSSIIHFPSLIHMWLRRLLSGARHLIRSPLIVSSSLPLIGCRRPRRFLREGILGLFRHFVNLTVPAAAAEAQRLRVPPPRTESWLAVT